MSDASFNQPRPWLAGLGSVMVALAMVIAALPVISRLEFSGSMENLNVATVLEIRRTGHWLVPTLEGEARLNKPPLTAWVTALFVPPAVVDSLNQREPAAREDAYRSLAFRVRLASLLQSCLTTLLVAAIAQIALGGSAPVTAAAAYATSFLVLRLGWGATTDVQMTLWIALGQLGIALALWRGRRWGGCTIAGVATGLAILSKGPVCLLFLVLPVVVLGILRFFRGRNSLPASSAGPGEEFPALGLRNILGPCAVGMLLALAVGVPWFLSVYMKSPGVVNRWTTEITRVGATDNASSNPIFYLAAIAFLTPWLPWAIVGMVSGWRAIRGGERVDASEENLREGASERPPVGTREVASEGSRKGTCELPSMGAPGIASERSREGASELPPMGAPGIASERSRESANDPPPVGATTLPSAGSRAGARDPSPVDSVNRRSRVRGVGDSSQHAFASPAAWLLIAGVLPLIVMSFFPDRKDRYALPAFIPLALLVAHGMQVLLTGRGLLRRVLVALHYATLAAVVIGLPIAAATILKTVDDRPWLAPLVEADKPAHPPVTRPPVIAGREAVGDASGVTGVTTGSIAAPAATGVTAGSINVPVATGARGATTDSISAPSDTAGGGRLFVAVAVMILAGGAVLGVAILLQRHRPMAIVAATVVVMLGAQVLGISGYSLSRAGRSEMKPLADAIRAEIPDVKTVLNARRDRKRISVDLAIYLNESTERIADWQSLPQQSPPVVAVVPQQHGQPETPVPPGWRVLAKVPRDRDWWWALAQKTD